IIRRRVTEYPDSTFAQPFATRFDAAYRATFDTSGLMVNDLYLSVLIHPVADPALGTFASLEKADATRLAHWQDESIERLDSAVRALTAGLYRYDPQILGIVDRRGLAFSETAEFLGFLLSGTHRPVPISRERLIDAASVTIEADRRLVNLPTNRPLHMDYAYTTTAHSAQGLTCDRVLYNAESFSRTTAQDTYYVSISRERHEVTVFTDDAEKLPERVDRQTYKGLAQDLQPAAAKVFGQDEKELAASTLPVESDLEVD